MKYQVTKNGKTYTFDWNKEEPPTEEESNKIADQMEKWENPVSNFFSKDAPGGKALESIKESPPGKFVSWTFTPPDFIEDLRKQGQELIDQSEGPTPSIKSASPELDKTIRGGHRKLAKGALDLLTPSRADIATAGVGLARKPLLKAGEKAVEELGDFAKIFKELHTSSELGSEAGVLKVGTREAGKNPRLLGTNPRAIKAAEEKLDEIVDLVAAGESKENIASKLGLKEGTIDSILKKHKISNPESDIEQAVNKVSGEDDIVLSDIIPSGGGGGNKPPKPPRRGKNPPPFEPPPEDPKLPKSFGREKFEFGHLKDLISPFQRSMQSLGEMSFPLRQGAVALTAHPTLAPEVFRNMFKGATRPGFADEVIAEIGKRPFANVQEFVPKTGAAGIEFEPVTRNLYQEAKLGLSDPTDVFPSQLAHTIPGVAQLSKRSEAAYGAGADTLRANLFDQVLKKRGFSMENLPSSDEIKQLGNYVNTVTGYGRGGDAFERAVPAMQYGIYSPRYQKSRFDMLNPVNYTGMTKRFGKIGAQEMAKDAAKFGGTMLGAGLGLDAASDDIDFNLNPLDTDFLKTKVGNTRFDLIPGFAPFIRTGSRVAQNMLQRGMGKDDYVEAAEPYLGDLASKNYDPLFEVANFARSKAAPGLPSFGLDMTIGKGKNVVGEPLENQDYFGTKFTGEDNPLPFEAPYLGYALRQSSPLYYQDMGDIYNDTGISPTLGAAAPLGFFGTGTMTYDKEKNRKPKDNPYAEVDRLYKKLYGR